MKTHLSCDIVFARWLRKESNEKFIGGIRPEMVALFVRSLHDRDLSHATVNKYVAAIAKLDAGLRAVGWRPSDAPALVPVELHSRHADARPAPFSAIEAQKVYAYDLAGNRTSLLDANGQLTTFAYDNVNRLTTIDYPTPDADVALTYTVRGERTEFTDGVGTTALTYDALSRPLTVTDPFNGQVGYRYDAGGNRTQLLYPDGKAVTYTYDAANRLIQLQDWSSRTTGYTYTALGQPLLVNRPGGLTTSYQYDAANRLLTLGHSVEAGLLAVYSYTVNAVGDRTAVTETVRQPDPPPATDLLFADGFESGGLSAWSSSTTDGGDLAVTSTAALAGIKGMQAVIDDNNAIYVTDDTPNAETRYRVRFYFDPNSMTMGNNNAHYIFYGNVGASTQVLRIEFRYSGGYQLRAELRGDGNSWTSTSWFALNDAPHAVELDWKAASAAGANNGSLTLWLDGTQLANLVGVDNDTRRIDRVQWGAVAGLDSGTRGTYDFDAFEARRSTYIGPLPQPTVTTLQYGYDPLDRLLSAGYSTGEVFTYTYDAVGNRLTEQTQAGSLTSSYDDANRLTSVGGVSYAWDSNGNLLSDGIYTYTYDTANHLIGVTDGLTPTTFAYTGLGDRVGETTAGVTTTFTLDLAAGLTQVLADGTTSYLYGNGRVAESAGANVEYFLPDGLGSVRQLADSSGSVKLAKSYEPYGEQLSSSGTGSTNYGFTGEWSTSNVKLIDLRARWLDPATGRFLSQDTFGGGFIKLPNPGATYEGTDTSRFVAGDWPSDYTRPQSLNRWAYSLSNPVNYTDPSGHQPVGPGQDDCLVGIWLYDPITGSMQWVCLIPRSPTPNPQPTPTTPVEDWLCSKPAKKQEKEDEQVREPVRVQLQNNLETESIPIEDLGDGVTTAQVVDALSTLNLLVPRRLQRNAAPAYRKAVKWTLERPPYGVSAVTKKSFYFDPYIDDWRFDIEVLDGHHLKR